MAFKPSKKRAPFYPLALLSLWTLLSPLWLHWSVVSNLLAFLLRIFTGIISCAGVILLIRLMKGGYRRNAALFLVCLFLYWLACATLGNTYLDVAVMVYYLGLGSLVLQWLFRRNGHSGVYLKATMTIFVLSFLAECIQGLLPHATYNLLDVGRNLLYAFIGMAAFRFLDTATPLSWRRDNRSKRTYVGKAPLLDLHISAFHLLWASPLLLIFFFHYVFTVASQPSFEEGTLFCEEVHHRPLCIHFKGPQMAVMQQPADTFDVFYATMGNLLDGYSLSFVPSRRRPSMAWKRYLAPLSFRCKGIGCRRLKSPDGRILTLHRKPMG